jgi:acyl-CoA thioester hydrolase
VVEVETRVTEIGGASVIMHQVLRRGEEVLCRADVTIAHLKAGRPARLAPALRAAFSALL